MKALILAAGFGSRLAPITNSIPKSLVPVNGKPILHKQIDNLLENGVTEILVVAGYKSEILIDSLNKNYPTISVMVSADYATTNNMYSAFIGIKELGFDDDILMMNADVFFDSSVIKKLLEFDKTNAIVTDIGSYNDESMKVIEINGRIIEISKQITEDKALGNSIDVYKFGKEALKSFYDKCYEYIVDKKDCKKWSEVALNDILISNKFAACPLVGRWFEIDNFEDLSAAEKLFK